jgi:hypothetical protein
MLLLPYIKEENGMSKSIISQITVVCQQGVASYDVGSKVEGREIVEIKDVSMEYENGITLMYQAFDKEGNILKSIENCSCDITYKVMD